MGQGKSCETFNPLSPWLVTADEIGDSQHLALRLWVNGEPPQDGSTKNMIFGLAETVRYLSRIMVLDPGCTLAISAVVNALWDSRPSAKASRCGCCSAR